MLPNLWTILMIFIANIAFAQTATFSADTLNLRKYANNQGLFERILEREWIIQGQRLTYTSTPIQVIPDPQKIDTIYFKLNKQSAYDTILCNISEPNDYEFVYNTCCDGFNVKNNCTGQFTRGSVIFKIEGKAKKKKYMGSFGCAGELVQSKKMNHLKETCCSAMSPNIYPVSFSEIDLNPSIEENFSESLMCLFDDYQERFDFRYKIITTKTKFLYMPLNTEPLMIIYHPKTNEIELTFN